MIGRGKAYLNGAASVLSTIGADLESQAGLKGTSGNNAKDLQASTCG